jgi:Domain of unknown function (DUF1707)/2TM domain
MTALTRPATNTRAGDREREATAAHLGQALAQGYLDMAEYEDRVRAAFGAHTTGELRHLLGDLPVSRLRHDDPRRRAARHAAARMSVRIHLAAYLLMVVVVLTVWLAVALSAGAWYFWPVWPIVGAGIGVVAHAIPISMATSR